MIYQINTLFQFNDTVYIKNNRTRALNLLNAITQTTFYRSFLFTIITQVCYFIKHTATSACSETSTPFCTGEGKGFNTLVITNTGIRLTILKDSYGLIQNTYGRGTRQKIFIISNRQNYFVARRLSFVMSNPSLGRNSIEIIYRFISFLCERNYQSPAFIRNSIFILLDGSHTVYRFLHHFQHTL